MVLRPEVQNQAVAWTALPLEVLQKDASLLFQLPGLSALLGLWLHLSALSSHCLLLCETVHVLIFHPCCLPLSFSYDICDGM